MTTSTRPPHPATLSSRPERACVSKRTNHPASLKSRPPYPATLRSRPDRACVSKRFTLLLLLLLTSCKSPTPTPTDLGDAQTLTTTHLDAHLGEHVTVHGTPTPTAVVENGTCNLYYLIENRHIFINDCARDPSTLHATHTGRLEPFVNLPLAEEIAAFYQTRFDIRVPTHAYVIHVEP